MPDSAGSRREGISGRPGTPRTAARARARGLLALRRRNTPTAADSTKARLGPLLPPPGPLGLPSPGAGNGRRGRAAGHGAAPSGRQRSRAAPCRAVPRGPSPPPAVPRPRRAPPPRRHGSFVPEATGKRGMGGGEKEKKTINIDKQRDSLQPSH